MTTAPRSADASETWTLFHEDGKAIPAVRDMHVERASAEDVRQFASRWHYSGSAGSVTWGYGLWHGLDLWAVVAYNNPTRDVGVAILGEEHCQSVLHMGRLIGRENGPRNSESRLIGGSLRLLARDVPYARAVVTYAATDVGHIGIVYQATNALYLGAVPSEPYYLDQSGRRRSTKQTVRVTRPEAKMRGWTLQRGGPKHRYLYLLGDRRRRAETRRMLRVEPQSYPPADEQP